MMHNLSMAAIFRDEAPYLREWIEFHLLVGFEHFYLFDNLSQDDFQSVLQPYVDQGVVELFSWPIDHYNWDDWDPLQCLAYERMLFLARGKTRWLALIDIDEFLFSPKEEHLGNTLARYEDFGGVGVNWQIYGTSHVAKIPQGSLLIEELHLKQPEAAPSNHNIKSIVQPDRVESCSHPHFMSYRAPYFQVNTDALAFEGQKTPYVQIDTLRINHYRARDERYLHTKKIPRERKWWNSQPKEPWEAYFRAFNAVSDKEIFRLIPRLKERLLRSTQIA